LLRRTPTTATSASPPAIASPMPIPTPALLQLKSLPELETPEVAATAESSCCRSVGVSVLWRRRTFGKSNRLRFGCSLLDPCICGLDGRRRCLLPRDRSRASLLAVLLRLEASGDVSSAGR
jgi:hypothetical protein